MAMDLSTKPRRLSLTEDSELMRACADVVCRETDTGSGDQNSHTGVEIIVNSESRELDVANKCISDSSAGITSLTDNANARNLVINKPNGMRITEAQDRTLCSSGSAKSRCSGLRIGFTINDILKPVLREAPNSSLVSKPTTTSTFGETVTPGFRKKVITLGVGSGKLSTRTSNHGHSTVITGDFNASNKSLLFDRTPFNREMIEQKANRVSWEDNRDVEHRPHIRRPPTQRDALRQSPTQSDASPYRVPGHYINTHAIPNRLHELVMRDPKRKIAVLPALETQQCHVPRPHHANIQHELSRFSIVPDPQRRLQIVCGSSTPGHHQHAVVSRHVENYQPANIPHRNILAEQPYHTLPAIQSLPGCTKQMEHRFPYHVTPSVKRISEHNMLRQEYPSFKAVHSSPYEHDLTMPAGQYSGHGDYYRKQGVVYRSTYSAGTDFDAAENELMSSTKWPTEWPPEWPYVERPSLDYRINNFKSYDESLETESKRPRTAFTDVQLLRLRAEFQTNCYLSEERRHALAWELDLGENQIKIWFQNNRAKLKKTPICG